MSAPAAERKPPTGADLDDAEPTDTDSTGADPTDADHGVPEQPRAGALTPIRTVTAFWAVTIRSFAFVRKEVVEIVRQPRLIALLVVGPFILLLMFGFGYGNDSLQKRAAFVGPAGSVYEDVLATYDDQLDDFIESTGLVNDLGEARAMLDAGEVDVVVVFPDDPLASVMNGERAVIEVLHGEIDPIQEAAVEIAARLAVQEVNATVLAAVVSETQDQLQDAPAFSARFADLAGTVLSDPVATRDDVRAELDRLSPALDGSSVVLARLDGTDPEVLAAIDETRRLAAALGERAATIDESTSDAELGLFAEAIDDLAVHVADVIVLDPQVLVRPFDSRTDNVTIDSITPTDFFTPASLALLLQHLALTFAALSLVRDRRTGLFELMRVGPLSSIEIILGKIFAYLLVGSVVGAALVAAAVVGLGVSLVGSIGWLAVVIIGVLLASLSLGMMLAIVSKSESQAVQFAMLVLLAGLFFSGFVLPIESLRYPVKVISWLLPVTYGISGMQDIMLRGDAPSNGMVIGLAALVVGYGAVAVVGLRRQLRTSGA